MSAMIHVFGEDNRIEIECCADDGKTIWIRERRGNRVSLTLEPHQLDALEAAIAVVRKAQAVAS